ncbi:hypothetical protein [Geodermatophilus sp. FMUSA9-8]|uniref:hypothetical protein n=1 Tax=Geodermatophilus sp. FMUSA9-8 TaxID=3120155 RepID=UPI0030095CA5
MAAAGCSESRSDRQDAGSRIDSVLAVPEDAELLGTVFPAEQEGDWDAVLIITGTEPLVVLQDLMEQVGESGYDVSTFDQDGDVCTVRSELLWCEILASREDAPESYQVSLHWGESGGASFRHVLVRRQSFDNYFPPNVTTIQTDLPSPPAPIDEWDAPEVGELVAIPPDAFDPDGTVVVLEPGGRVTGPPGHSWSLTGGYNVVVALDDDADAGEVLAAYAVQFENLGFQGTTNESGSDGNTSGAARYSQAGGGSLEAVIADDSKSGDLFLLLSRSND